MALLQASRPPGAGSGGLVITNWVNYQFTQETDFIANEVVLNLPFATVALNSFVVDYNGQILHLDVDYSVLNTSTIQILFADPYVTTYDQPPVFQVIYPR